MATLPQGQYLCGVGLLGILMCPWGRADGIFVSLYRGSLYRCMGQRQMVLEVKKGLEVQPPVPGNKGVEC